MKNRGVLFSLLCATAFAAIAVQPIVFSAMKPGDTIAAPLRIIALPKIPPNRFEFVADEGKTVLLVTSQASAATVGIPLVAPPARSTRIEWRWKIDNVLAAADMEQKSGDDFAARLYVFFDAPMERLTFFERTKVRLVRLIWGEEIPTAVLCYVWDNKHPPGFSQASPYTSLVRVMVLQSGPGSAGKWVSESRDVAADFKAQFGYDAPAITGIAVGSDTDQTGESVRTWFGDVTLKTAAP